jgi:hypothetical protein
MTMTVTRRIGLGLGAAASLVLPAGALAFSGGLPASASVTMGRTAEKSELVGVLGYEGGAAPGGFHPTSGWVEVAYTNTEPLSLVQRVGATGHFRIPLGPGTYAVTGCGPFSRGGNGPCGQTHDVTLKAGETERIRVVWADAP